MKKIILFLLLLTTHALKPMEPSEVDIIYQAIEPKIYGAAPSLKKFLRSQEADEFTQKVYPLPPDDKEQLMRKIYNTLGGDPIWAARRNYLAAIIQTGDTIDTDLGSIIEETTFLGDATFRSDKAAVTFALAQGANISIKCLDDYPLCLARNCAIARLLLKKGADVPLKNDPNPNQQFTLLEQPLSPLGAFVNNGDNLKLLRLFKKAGFDFQVKDDVGKWTLLHSLCMSATEYQNAGVFSEICTFLLKAGVDWKARDRDDETALDIINSYLEDDPCHPILLKAQSLLEKLKNTPQ